VSRIERDDEVDVLREAQVAVSGDGVSADHEKPYALALQRFDELADAVYGRRLATRSRSFTSRR
jgi:hypothetical protein